MKIILIGFMGSGKSTIAKKLEYLLKLPIIEMDELVFQKTKTKDMHEIFAKGGELLLRATEIAIAQEHATTDNAIVSTGAGVVMNKIILDYLKKPNDKIYFLNVPFQTLSMRLANDRSRPLFKNSLDAKSLYNFRQPLYLQYADHVIEADKKTTEEIAQEIVESCLTPSVIGKNG
jgi:shikimate kinase